MPLKDSTFHQQFFLRFNLLIIFDNFNNFLIKIFQLLNDV